MISIYIITTTRAEYGLMRPLIKRMSEDKDISVKLLVSGTHLSDKYGHTIDEIIKDGYADIKEIDILSNRNDSNGISETMANALRRFSEYFFYNKPDYLLIDGDRYESLAIAIAGVNNGIPIIHNGGGCVTEGVLDEYYRHAITKMSNLHFTSTDVYRNRIVQMGENPNRVFSVGSLGIENILNTPLMTREELSKQIGFCIDSPYAVLTYHPTIQEDLSQEEQIEELLKSINRIHDIKFIITGANADAGGEKINNMLKAYCEINSHALFVESLGTIRYFTALKYCDFVIGNSSSGLIEAPSFGIPTVNIGDRQKGRIKAKSIIDCKIDSNSIQKAIYVARDSDFKNACKHVVNPNGDGKTSERMLKEIKNFHEAKGDKTKKNFYDICFN